MLKNAEIQYVAALNRLKAGKPNVVTGEYTINLDTIAAECGLKRGSIMKDRLSEAFKTLLRETTEAWSEGLREEPQSKLKIAKDECKALRNEVKRIQAELDSSVAREMNLALELLRYKGVKVKSVTP